MEGFVDVHSHAVPSGDDGARSTEEAVELCGLALAGEIAREPAHCRPLFVGGAAARCYFPRDLFFCFFAFKLTIGAFTPVPRDTGLGAGCSFDFPAMPILLNRGRETANDPTLQAVGQWACPVRGSHLAKTLASSEGLGAVGKRLTVKALEDRKVRAELARVELDLSCDRRLDRPLRP
jgi:hypothetical protein